MKSGKTFWGLLFIGIGLLFLINLIFNIVTFTAETFWPLFVLVPGIVFELYFFTTRKNPGLLVPGGILTIIGIMFFFETFTNWYFMKYSWPVFIVAVAVGLFQFYFFTGKPKKLLIPVSILFTIGVISLAGITFMISTKKYDFSVIIAAIFVIAGLVLLFKK